MTGENDVTPEEERQRAAAQGDDDKSRIQQVAHDVKDAVQEVMGTGKREASQGSEEERDMLRELRKRSDH
ncbi:hypothetical protein [Streptomyces subrutilus]|uniref:hypothetical protein n=1 Tax=Streptomyces subrutilus TaxID=36818 RepID=UPI0034028F6C